MTARDAGTGNTFTGTLYKTTGSCVRRGRPSARATADQAGTGTLTFTDAGHGTFDYNVNGSRTRRSRSRRSRSARCPTCTYSAAANLAGATNYQGLWWNANESGWGINFAHQGDTIFATWFTFDVERLAAVACGDDEQGSAGRNLHRRPLPDDGAPPFGATPFVDKTRRSRSGSATLTFANGNSAAFPVHDRATVREVTKHAHARNRSCRRRPATVCN